MKGMKLKIKRSKKETDVVEILSVQYSNNDDCEGYIYQMSCKSLVSGKFVTVQMTAMEVKNSLIA